MSIPIRFMIPFFVLARHRFTFLLTRAFLVNFKTTIAGNQSAHAGTHHSMCNGRIEEYGEEKGIQN
jgi:hypothetical protein